MPGPNDIKDAASRANDMETPREPGGNQGGRTRDGKHEDTAQGGKRRGPGRRVNPETSRD